jgi:hypothetical protein
MGFSSTHSYQQKTVSSQCRAGEPSWMCVPILWIIFGEILPQTHVNFEEQNVVLEYSINYKYNVLQLLQQCKYLSYTSKFYFCMMVLSITFCMSTKYPMFTYKQSTTTHSVLPLLEYWLLLADFHIFLSAAKGRDSTKFCSLGPCLDTWVWGLLQGS